MANSIEFISGMHFYEASQLDSNGNTRIIVHFLDFLTPAERLSDLSVLDKYNLAWKRAKSIKARTFKKYKGQDFGGGFVCQYDYKDCFDIALDIINAKCHPKLLAELLTEWTEQQTKKVKRTISKHFGLSIDALDEMLGLAYTSSGAFAGLWVTSEARYKDTRFYYRGFVYDGQVVYALLWNENEEEIYMPL